MDINFQEKMAGKSDEDLLTILKNMNKYVPEAIAAARAELEARGHSFSEEEQAQVEADMVKKIELKAQEEGIYLGESPNGDIVDWDAPKYYTKESIIVVSAFLTTFWGGVLMAINLGKKSVVGAVASILFGISFTGLTFYLMRQVPQWGWALGFLLNILGGTCISTLIWNRFIGRHTAYIKKPAWVVFAVVIAIWLLFFILSVLGINLTIRI